MTARRVGHPEHDVDRAGEVAAQRLVAEARLAQPVGVRQQRVVVRARCRRSSAPTSAQADVGGRRACRRRPAGSRSRARAAGRRRPISPRVSPAPSGPSGVWCSGTSAAASSSAPASTGHHASCSRTWRRSSASRSGASGVGLLEHRRAPASRRSRSTAGRPSATARRRRRRSTAPAGTVHRPRRRAATTSGSLLRPDRVSAAARTSPEYDVRRQAMSIARVNVRTPRPCGHAPAPAAPAAPTTTDSSTTGPPAACQRRKQRQRVGRRRSSARSRSGTAAASRPAAAQQPGEAAVGLVPGRRPPGHDLRLGAGQRDVGEPDVVAGDLAARQRLDLAGRRPGPCRRCRGSARRRGGRAALLAVGDVAG